MPSTRSAFDKTAMRQLVRRRRLALSAAEREAYSALIIERLRTHIRACYPQVQQLLVYRSINSEVDTTALFSSKEWRIFAPVTHWHDHMEWHECDEHTEWQTGLFGVPEPVTGNCWTPDDGPSLMLCPLIAFDRQGNRLGMGKGCFDFWLQQHRKSLQGVLALAFSCQEVAHIPAEPHDVPMHAIITETEVIPCPQG